MAAPVPDVEIADHRDAPGIRCPHSETHTIDAIDGLQLGAEATAQIAVIAFGEQIQIHFAEQLTKAIGIFRHLLAAGPARAQQIGPGLGEVPDKQPRGFGGGQFATFFTTVLVQHFNFQRTRQIGADELPAGTITVRAENGKRVAMFRTYQRVDVLRRRQ